MLSAGQCLADLQFAGIFSRRRCIFSDRAWKPVESRNSALQKRQRIFTTALLCYGGCAWDAFGRAGLLDSRFPTCVQLPPIRLETKVAAPHVKELDHAQLCTNESPASLPKLCPYRFSTVLHLWR